LLLFGVYDLASTVLGVDDNVTLLKIHSAILSHEAQNPTIQVR
jgi:hypothetical protein